jgi:hypothetical protein
MSLETRLVMRTALAVLITLVSITTAHATPPGLTLEAPVIETVDTAVAAVPVERVSYRWQIALVDLAAFGGAMIGPAFQGRDREVQSAALGTYLLGSPLIHAANGHGLRAIASLGLRLGLPALGAAIGVRIQGESDCLDCIDTAAPIEGLVLGIGIGGLTALIVDHAVLAKPRRVPARGWAPVAAPSRGGATVGVGGWF